MYGITVILFVLVGNVFSTHLLQNMTTYKQHDTSNTPVSNHCADEWENYTTCLNDTNWTSDRLQNVTVIINDICHTNPNESNNNMTIKACINMVQPNCYFTKDLDSYLDISLYIYVNSTCKINFLHERVSALLIVWNDMRKWRRSERCIRLRPDIYSPCDKIDCILNYALSTKNATKFTKPVIYDVIKNDPRVPECDLHHTTFAEHVPPDQIPLQGEGMHLPKPLEYQCRKQWVQYLWCTRWNRDRDNCQINTANCIKSLSKNCTYKSTLTNIKKYLINHYKAKTLNESNISLRLDLLKKCFDNITVNDVTKCKFGWKLYCDDFECLLHIMQRKCYDTADKLIRNNLIPVLQMDCNLNISCDFVHQGAIISKNKTQYCAKRNVDNFIVWDGCPGYTTPAPTTPTTAKTTTPVDLNKVNPQKEKQREFCKKFALWFNWTPLNSKILTSILCHEEPARFLDE